MNTPPPVFVLILAGGAGTRFWPASRLARPKQLLALTGDEPMLRATAERVLPLTRGWEHIHVATGAHLVGLTREALPEVPSANLLIEPSPRNTAPCIAWAAARFARIDPEAVVIVLPSDHHIGDEPRFREMLSRAVESATTGVITTVGLRPTHAETGFGYLELESVACEGVAQRVVRFVEKPDRSTAESFLAKGNYLWNGGMFIFRAADMVDAVLEHLPALAPLLTAVANDAQESDIIELFENSPSVSVDKGVMEHLREIAVIPGSFGWSDVGSWQSAWELGERDEEGNSAPEGALFIDSRNNHVVDLRSRSDHGQVISLLGVEDMVVVATDDALLVMPRSRSQDVREIVERLKAHHRGEHL